MIDCRLEIPGKLIEAGQCGYLVNLQAAFVKIVWNQQMTVALGKATDRHLVRRPAGRRSFPRDSSATFI